MLGLNLNTAPSRRERTLQVRVVALIGLCVGALFALFNLLSPATRVLGAVEALALALLVAPAYGLARRRRHVRTAEALVMAGAWLIFGALTVLGGVQGTGLNWVYTLPFLAFFLKGQRKGWWYSAGFALLIWAFLASPWAQAPWVYAYPPGVPTQFALALLFYTLLAANFNLLRARFEQRLSQRMQHEAASARAATARLQFLATHDELTGLPNRVALMQSLTQTLKRHPGDRLWLVDLRVGRLFALSNVLGPEAADQMVLQIARQLQALIAPWGQLARLRRDEFVIVAGLQAPWHEAAALAQHLLAHPVALDVQGLKPYVEFTLGLSCAPDLAQDARSLLRQAEQAMIQARSDLRRWAVYDAHAGERFHQHQLLAGALRDALAAQQLCLHYQPQVDLQNGARRVGVEALVRWPDAQKGWISPAEFIPVAEESGLIRPLTAWVLGQAVNDAAHWHRLGLRWSVSVNLSANNLLEADLLAQVSAALAQSGLPARALNIEVTESSFMASPQRAIAVLHELHTLGVGLSIDDFGTGYSSLAYLKNLPVHELKIDQAFVRDLLRDSGDQTIVRATVGMAHALGLSLVAEGIEDMATADWLAQLGCQIGQGYGFDRPMPLAQLLASAN